jgi:hypothetical protein
MSGRRVRVTQLDGSMPNLALMAIAAHHRALGDEVVFTTRPDRDLFEVPYDRVYGSAIFRFSAPAVADFVAAWPGAILGGTGTDSTLTVEDALAAPVHALDYSLYPEESRSIGFSQRGCRLRCGFCVVPGKEGHARAASAIAEIWRGPPHKKWLLLLDNDFFGQPVAEWQRRIDDIAAGGFKVCFNQGVNLRKLTDLEAGALAVIQYRDAGFQERRIYTAWDDHRHRAAFFRGVDRLGRAGVPPRHLRVYMLVGYHPGEELAHVEARFNELVAAGCEPFPMVFDCSGSRPKYFRLLKQYQRWAVTGLYRAVPFRDYDPGRKVA